MLTFLTNLRCRLILLVLMAVVPAFVLICYSAAKHREIAASQVKSNALATIRTIAAEQERVIGNAHQFLVTLARVPQIRGADKEACRHVLAGLLEPVYADLAVADRRGNITCAALPAASSIVVPDGPQHRRAMETYGFYVGDIRYHSATHKFVLDLGYPVSHSAGSVDSVVSAVLDLSRVMRATVNSQAQDAMTFSLVDDKGIILLRHPQDRHLPGKPIFSVSASGPMFLQDQHTAELKGADGIERLFAFQRFRYPINGRTVYAAIDIPTNVAFAQTRNILRHDLIVLGLLSTLALTAAWFGADIVVLRRIRDIIATTRHVAAGKLSARTTISYGKSELGHLARAFDDLVRTLEKREAEMLQAAAQIQTQRQRQRALYDLNRGITSTLDLNHVLKTLVHHVSELYPQCIVTVSVINKQSALEPMMQAEGNDSDALYSDVARLQCFPSLVLRQEAPVTISNVQVDPRTADPEFYRRHCLFSYLGLPLFANRRIVGVLSFYSREEREFSAEEMSFISALAHEAAIAVYNSQLFEQTREQAIELEKSNRIKDEFLGVMSHELRTPLNVIMNYVEVLKMETFGPLTPDQGSGLEKIGSHSEHLLSLINGILEITKIEGGNLALQEETVNLGAFMAECQSDHLNPSDKNLLIEWEYSGDLPTIITDRMKLKQILSNLVGNAIKFTDDGAVIVAATVLEPGPMLEIRVADSGTGIPNEELDRIFDKFRQVDSATTRHHSGAGLGLYIVKTFVDLFKGTIGVESKLGEGSVFTVRLPIKRDSCEAQANRLL